VERRGAIYAKKTTRSGGLPGNSFEVADSHNAESCIRAGQPTAAPHQQLDGTAAAAPS